MHILKSKQREDTTIQNVYILCSPTVLCCGSNQRYTGCKISFSSSFYIFSYFLCKNVFEEEIAQDANVEETEAERKFQGKHPNKVANFLNCAFVYTEEQFSKTGMIFTGNRGAFCHEVIC